MKNKNHITVFVGVSGGVDSSVSAGLLKDQGYNVVGVFIRTWTPDFLDCTWRDERRDAMRVCAHLGIPFLECDAEQAYKKGVADYMIEEYKKGNVPNPDVMCNREVKFGVFWNFARERGADFIATGHYASVNENSFREATGGGVPLRGIPSNGVKELREKLFSLERSLDMSKDQSYFLWTLTQIDLAHTLFPIGHMQKSAVRKLAEKYKLPTATKKDSQGVCFLGPLDMKEFLKHYIESKKGDVVLARSSEIGNEEGKVIGYHDGAVFLTLGERHGFTITEKTPSDKPYFVVRKDIDRNTITVSARQDLAQSAIGKAYGQKSFEIINVNWILSPEQNKQYTAQVRYHGEQLKCEIENVDTQKALIIFKDPILVSSGQSIVLYDGIVCMGGGVVI